MDKLLEFMQEGKYVFVNDFEGGDTTFEIPGFTKGKGGLEENEFIARNGEHIMLQSTTIRRGNALTASLRDRRSGLVENVKFRDFFPEQTVVIATCGESLQAFAPICNTRAELIRFLGKIEDFFATHAETTRSRDQDTFERLALFFYKNNPNKAVEREWGI